MTRAPKRVSAREEGRPRKVCARKRGRERERARREEVQGGEGGTERHSITPSILRLEVRACVPVRARDGRCATAGETECE